MGDVVSIRQGIQSYSSPFNLGHRALEYLWDVPVVAQEKADASQVSARNGLDGVLRMRSHHQELCLESPDKMFAPAIRTFTDLHANGMLPRGYTYRGEAFCSPHHNTLAYARMPKGGVILFDVDKGDQDYMMPDELAIEADRLGLEAVPCLAIYHGKPTLAELEALLNTPSVLGNTSVEGVVLKAYGLYGPDKKTLMGKLVNQKFKEENRVSFKSRNPSLGNIVDLLIEQYGTEARWRKAIQHLREQGLIKDEPSDIGPLLKEIQTDVYRECANDIREQLFKLAWKDISRGITKKFPEYYKAQLLAAAFPDSANCAQEAA